MAKVAPAKVPVVGAAEAVPHHDRRLSVGPRAAGTPQETTVVDGYGSQGALVVAQKLAEHAAAAAAERAPSPDAASEGEGDGASVVQGKLYNPANDPAVARRVIDPRSPRMQSWDLLIGLLLVYTALVTPYEVAFLETTWPSVLFVINRFVDLCFLTDLVMNFFLAYYDAMTRVWVCSHRKIAYRYMTGWFFLDVASILPFDSLTIILENTGDAQAAADFKKLKIFRVIRLLRLLKLMRLVRGARILQRWENRISIRFSVLSLLKFLISTLIISHWIACLLRLTTDIEMAGGEGADHVSWMTEYTLQPGCAPPKSVAAGGDARFVNRGSSCTMDQAAAGEQYTAALYWSVMTLTTIGYGDVVAKTQGERVLVIVCMIIGAGVYAYIVGAVCGIVASMDEVTTQYHQRMDNLNAFMEESSLPHELRLKLRGFFQHTRSLLRHDYYRQIIMAMSPELRGSVTVYLNAAWIQKVPFFNTPDTAETSQFITDVSVRLEPAVYGKEEWVVQMGSRAKEMWLVQKGIAARSGGRIFTSGRYFGEEMVCSHARRDYEVKALTVLDLLCFTKQALDDILENGEYPLTRLRVRKAVIRMAFLNKFVKTPKVFAEGYAALEGAAGNHASEGRSDNTVQDAVAYLRDMQQRATDVSRFLLGEGTLDPGTLRGGGGGGGGGGVDRAVAAAVADTEAAAEAAGHSIGGAAVGGARRRSLVGIVPAAGGAMVTIADSADGSPAMGGVNIEIPNLDEKMASLKKDINHSVTATNTHAELKMTEVRARVLAPRRASCAAARQRAAQPLTHTPSRAHYIAVAFAHHRRPMCSWTEWSRWKRSAPSTWRISR